MKKFLKIFFGTLLLVVVAILVGVYIFIKTFDLNKYKDQIAALVKEHLGRELVIAGDARLGISLIPTLEIDDITLSNAGWASNPLMIGLKRVEIRVSILPLLKKQIVIDKVALVEPKIFLEKDKDGKVNWDFGKKEETTVAAVATKDIVVVAEEKKTETNPALTLLAGFAAKNVSIKNGLVQFDDKTSGKATNVNINDINLSAASPDDNIKMNFDVALDKEPIKGSMTLGSLNTFIAKQPYPVALVVNAFKVDLSVSGTASDIMDNPAYDLMLKGHNPKNNFGAPETDFKIGLKGDVSKVTAVLESVVVNGNEIKGNVFADISGKVPYIQADLNSNLINLASFQESKTAFVMPSLISSAEASTLVPDTAVPYDLMKMANADILLNIKKLMIQEGMDADNVSLTTSLKDGVLMINPLSLNFGGGDINIVSQINSNEKHVTLDATSKKMLLQNLHKEFLVTSDSDFGVLDGGAVDIDIRLTTYGDNYRQLEERLNGQMVVIIDKTKFKSGNLAFFAGDFINQLLKTINLGKIADREIDLNCGVVRADFRNGKAEFPAGIAFDTNQMNLVSDGKINLINDNIDFSLRPFAGKIKDINVAQALTSFIAIKGTVVEPKITVDNKQALKTAVGVVANAPVYIGGAVLVDTDEAPCYTALKGTPYEERFPKPTGAKASTQEAYKDTAAALKKQVKDVKQNAKVELNNIKDNAKNLLNSFKSPKKTAAPAASVGTPEVSEPAAIAVPTAVEGEVNAQ